ncbi:MAG TPA: OmpA family protein, partial [Candidatus Eisenbacteria bacterium]|nr:OmpA family protein [Candidatus Eisenbacteria bacterium]
GLCTILAPVLLPRLPGWMDPLRTETPDEVNTMHSGITRIGTLLAAAAFLAAGTTGCASLNKTQKGAIVGAAGGAAVGGVVGKYAGSTTKGAIIGAVVGGAAGAVIGHRMDEKAQELEAKLPGAKVDRVGEGILVTFPSGLLFDFDSDAVRGEASHNLNTLAESLEKYDNSDLLIVGHTDDVGTESYNQGLSERRADAAANYLRARGVRRSIRTVGRGEDEPIVSNATDEGRSKNRRVEVAIYASEEFRDQAASQAASR